MKRLGFLDFDTRLQLIYKADDPLTRTNLIEKYFVLNS